MSLYIVFSFCILVLGKQKVTYTLLFISIIVYQTLFLGFTFLTLSLEFYLCASILLSVLFAFCIYDWDIDANREGFDYIWLAEVVSVLSLKIIEILFIINPEKFYIPLIGYHYFHLDGYFIGSILFVMFCKEVGYNPLKYNFGNFRKYFLSALVSYIFLIIYV